jgi:hypothetical protein
VLLLTAGVQLKHLWHVVEITGCETAFRSGLASTFVASIGPTTSEAIARRGLTVDASALAGGRLLGSLLFEIRPTDLPTLAGASVGESFVAVIGVASCPYAGQAIDRPAAPVSRVDRN